METKEYRFQSGSFSFSMLNQGCALKSLVVPDRDGNPTAVVLSATPSDERIWDVRHEKDGFTLHTVMEDVEVWTRFSLTSNGVFCIHHKACPTKDRPFGPTVPASFCMKGFEKLGLKDGEDVGIGRPFGQSRGFIRFATVRDDSDGIVMDCYSDMPGYRFHTDGKVFGFDFSACDVKADELFESTTSYVFRTDRPSGLYV